MNDAGTDEVNAAMAGFLARCVQLARQIAQLTRERDLALARAEMAETQLAALQRPPEPPVT